MNCVILVLQNPFFAPTDSKGAYRIANVPAGTYKVKAWHERLPGQNQGNHHSGRRRSARRFRGRRGESLETIMQKPGSSSLSFRSKVLIPVLAFLFLVPVVTLTVMQRRVTAQFERDAERKLKTAQRIFQSYLEKRSGFLHARYRNLVRSRVFAPFRN